MPQQSMLNPGTASSVVHRHHELEAKGGIDMTPMIDVVFQLILFFMLTSALDRPNQIELNLPQSTSGVKAEADQSLIVTCHYVDGKPLVKVNDQAIEGGIASLGEALQKVADPSKNPPVNVMFDKGVPMQDGVNIIDAMRDAGFQHFSLQTVAANARGFERAAAAIK